MGSPRRPQPPPPPPPPPPPAVPSPPAAARGERLRALHWEPLPAARVRGRRSVWAPRPPPPPLDLPRLRLLFREPRGATPGQRPTPAVSVPRPLPRSPVPAGRAPARSDRAAPRRQRCWSPSGASPSASSSSSSSGRCARSCGTSRRASGHPTGLRSCWSCPGCCLVPQSYTQRLELLVLQEEFFPRLSALRGSIQTLTDAATELLECEELHTILHLILSTGNHLNSGGYAGSAVGFRIASLLKLPDTKANEPGVDLLHFVAMEAARMQRDLLDFPSKLPHVGPASRIEQAEVEGELRRLSGRLAGARSLGAAGLGPRLPPFLRAAEEELRGTRAAMERLHRSAAAALDFYCEEAAPGGLQELCAVLHGFAGRFLGAVQVPARPARPAPPPPGPRRALTPPPPPPRRTGRGSRRGGGGSSWSSSGRSAAPVASCSARDAEPGAPRPLPALPPPFAAPPALQRRHTAPELPALPEPRGGPEPRPPEPPAPAPAPFFGLFQRKGPGAPGPARAAPSEGSALLGFLRRLAGGRAARGPPQLRAQREPGAAGAYPEPRGFYPSPRASLFRVSINVVGPPLRCRTPPLLSPSLRRPLPA
uniref:FH2 domain-containing protein n=1 Tax=Anas platyrhynchos TaxID=8839 RepID=A0A8B9ZFM1_ANAPL